FGMRLE
ncbi:hypothetical protein D043_1225B, partial [Vibrio parahaemolyticus EKP-021]